MIIQDHTSLDGLTDENLATTKAIGVDYIAIMHPPPPKPNDDNTQLWRDVRKQVESHGMKFNNVVDSGNRFLDCNVASKCINSSNLYM